MEFQHVGAAGQLVEAIHVLGDDQHRRGLFQADKGLVGCIGFGRGDEAAAPVVPSPDEFGIAGEGAGCGEILGPVLAPQAVLFSPEGGDAAGRGNTRSRQHSDTGFGCDSIPDLFEFRSDVRIHHHVPLIRVNPGIAGCASKPDNE